MKRCATNKSQIGQKKKKKHCDGVPIDSIFCWIQYFVLYLAFSQTLYFSVMVKYLLHGYSHPIHICQIVYQVQSLGDVIYKLGYLGCLWDKLMCCGSGVANLPRCNIYVSIPSQPIFVQCRKNLQTCIFFWMGLSHLTLLAGSSLVL